MSDLAQRVRDAGFSEWLVDAVVEFARAELEETAFLVEDNCLRSRKQLAAEIRERQR